MVPRYSIKDLFKFLHLYKVSLGCSHQCQEPKKKKTFFKKMDDVSDSESAKTTSYGHYHI
jgi:hypothetical protein